MKRLVQGAIPSVWKKNDILSCHCCAFYFKAEKVKSDAIHGNFPLFASVFYIFEKNGWTKKMKISS